MMRGAAAVRRMALFARASESMATATATGQTCSWAPRAMYFGAQQHDKQGGMRDLKARAMSTGAGAIEKPSADEQSQMVPQAPQSTALPVAFEDSYYDKPHYHRLRGDPTKRAYTYLILGTTKFIAASTIRVLILNAVYTMSAAADVLAMGSLEVDLSNVPVGQSATIKWRGKPVFIRHRTQDEIEYARKDDDAPMRDPSPDALRCPDPEWAVFLGVCTHLGCVPIANAGDYKGWFCPCHGSHYDLTGRIRKGPAPLNLEIPPHQFLEGNKLLLG
ncbi:Cytochrome b-c1 complex subunit Rieske, mitochondrial [Porphyridium purpureum]|uniref:Cytochrome b-c1 complex subunit Rieske, mitochondrial n=1 Tax=Porphyridium purpureum TaxID=35688 RepID=A0A5J4ZAV4_PORPP|nr:Cytochrome b-c1 complex subunit Rieske, mitochondrial [Porphyridium purpureum]|eukprot:POR7136..scf295_1